MLYLVGLGLDKDDMSLKGMKILKKCDEIYCELYTSKWNGLEELEKLIEKKIIVLEREKVESNFLIESAKEKDIALLVPGDPLTATTHIELMTESKKQNIDYNIIHSSSIYTAVSECGLMIYKFGRATTLVKEFEAASPYDVIYDNKKIDLHTLVLLDIEMSAKEGLGTLLDLEGKKKKNVINENKKIIVCSCLGTKKQKIKYDTIENLIKEEFDIPAVLIIPGKLNFKEEEALELWD